MKTLMSLVIAVGTTLAVAAPAFAENDNLNDSHNAKEFYKKLDDAKGSN